MSVAATARERLTLLLGLARRVEAVEWREASSYADLLGERHPSILWLHEPAALPPAGPMLFDELANDEVRADHARVQPVPSGVGVACLHDVLISGASLVGTASSLYQLGPLAPLYVDDFLSRDAPRKTAPVGTRTLRGCMRRVVPGVTVLLTHWNSATYGHWLLENMPKLLLLRRIASELPPFRIVLPRSLPGWVTSWIRLLLPDAATEVYDQRRAYLQCETLLMPTLLMHPAHFFHPELGVLLRELQDDAVRAARPTAGPRLYVSRVAPSHFRVLANQSEIEAIAVEEGLTLVKPETMPIAEQIALFASAQLIVGEFGSGMHNALFSASETRVFCLNWINGLQSRIAQLNRQQVGYLLPSDGVPVKFSETARLATYHIDPQQFRRCLRTLL